MGSLNLLGVGKAAAAAGGNGLLTNLAAYLKFDESSGSRADAHASYTFAETGTVGAVAGKLNNCAGTYNGSNYLSNASLYNDAIKNNNSHSVSLWFFASSLLNNPIAVSADLEFYIETGPNTIYWGYGATFRTYTVTLTTGVWYHIVAVKTGAGDSGDLYMGGALESSYSGTLPSATNNSAAFYAGHFPTAPTIDLGGYLDEIAVWSRSLNGTDAAALYNSGNVLPYSSFS